MLVFIERCFKRASLAYITMAVCSVCICMHMVCTYVCVYVCVLYTYVCIDYMYVRTRDGMIHQCIAVSQNDTGIDTTFNVLVYCVLQ